MKSAMHTGVKYAGFFVLAWVVLIAAFFLLGWFAEVFGIDPFVDDRDFG